MKKKGSHLIKKLNIELLLDIVHSWYDYPKNKKRNTISSFKVKF